MPAPGDELAARRQDEHQGENVAIEDVDCTPRPRFRETPDAFARRMRGYGLEPQKLERSVGKLNRDAALRKVAAADGTTKHVTSCACSWHGLEHADPEVARREYDAHPCSINGDAIHRTYRGPVDKRAASSLIPATAEERAAKGVTLPGEEPRAATASPTTLDEDAEQRAALLEMA